MYGEGGGVGEWWWWWWGWFEEKVLLLCKTCSPYTTVQLLVSAHRTAACSLTPVEIHLPADEGRLLHHASTWCCCLMNDLPLLCCLCCLHGLKHVVQRLC